MPVGAGAWAVLLLLALSIFLAMEAHKWVWNRRRPPQARSE
jgi:hypothetical protein